MLISNLFNNPLYLIVFICAFLFAVTIHEYAHALMAYRSGDPTAKIEGRLSLNPFIHLDALGTLFIFIIGFGWAKPVPINPANFNHKTDELKVAFAGIVANIIAAFILAIPIRIALIQGVTIESSLILTILNFFVEINLILAAFNLLPIPPLDGSYLADYFLDEPAKESYHMFGPYLLLGLLIIGQIGQVSIISLIMEPILRILSFIVRGTIIS